MRVLFSTQNYNKEELKANGIILNDSLDKLKSIINNSKGFQLDVETNMTETYYDKKLLLVQIGSLDGKHQFIFDVNNLTEEQFNYLIELLLSDKLKYIHNALFEYTVIKNNLIIDIDKIRCTYCMSRLTVLGLNTPTGYHSLKGILKRLKGIDMDKAAQTTFHDGILEVYQLNYAFDDVVYIYEIHQELQEVIDYFQLENAVRLKCAALRCYGDMLSKAGGIYLNQEKWLARNEIQKKKAERLKNELNQYLIDNYSDFIYSNEYAYKEDKVEIKWGSPKLKKELLQLVYGDKIESTNKVKLIKLSKEVVNPEVLEYVINREFDKAEQYFLENHKEFLLEKKLLHSKGEIKFNWNSTKQRLALFQIDHPKLKKTDADALKNISSPMIDRYKEYISAAKACSSYGEQFIINNVDPDGKVRPRDIDFFKSTGRTAIGILSTMPADNKYRNCFEALEDTVIIDADYNALELAIIANLSNETRWLDTIKAGKDLHSSNCGLIFGQEWIDNEGNSDEHGFWGKPVTPWGKTHRQFSKTLSFGLSYGMTSKRLSERLNISKKEAQELIDKFFNTFNHIQSFLEGNALSGQSKLYSETAKPFLIKRFYDEPANQGEMAAIGRNSKNHPVQGTAATITELAMIYLKKELDKLPKGVVSLLFPVHDEILICSNLEYKDIASKLLEESMCKAGDAIFPNKTITAEAETSKVWKK